MGIAVALGALTAPVKGHAMRERTARMPMIAISFALVASTPAWAWGGGGRSGAVGFPVSTHVQVMPQAHGSGAIVRGASHGNFREIGHARARGGAPVVIWPYVPYFDTGPVVAEPSVASVAPVGPQVIVLSNPPNGASGPTVTAPPVDDSYVAGCRAIPNGYHCDLPQDPGAPR